MAKKRGMAIKIMSIEMDAKITRLETTGSNQLKNGLASPLDVKIIRDDGAWIITNDRYTVRCWGNTLEKAFISMAEDLEMLRKEYYLEKDENLTADAICLKKNLGEIFG